MKILIVSIYFVSDTSALFKQLGAEQVYLHPSKLLMLFIYTIFFRILGYTTEKHCHIPEPFSGLLHRVRIRLG